MTKVGAGRCQAICGDSQAKPVLWGLPSQTPVARPAAPARSCMIGRYPCICCAMRGLCLLRDDSLGSPATRLGEVLFAEQCSCDHEGRSACTAKVCTEPTALVPCLLLGMTCCMLSVSEQRCLLCLMATLTHQHPEGGVLDLLLCGAMC